MSNEITVFLASSIVELKADRESIAAKFLQWGDEFFDTSGVRLRLYRAESIDDSFRVSGKQAELDSMIENADIVIFLFGAHVGEHTKNELEHAISAYKKNMTPKVYTFFKQVNTIDASIVSLQEELQRENHYYSEYSTIDGMMLQLREAIDKTFLFKASATTSHSSQLPVIKIVDSQLAVVHSFIKGAAFETLFPNTRIKYINKSWGMPTIEYCESGKAQFCIANRKSFETYLEGMPNSRLIDIGSIGYSMGGRSFAILAKVGNPLIGAPLGEIKEGLNGATVFVGLKTDRFSNLKTVLNVQDQWFSENNVTLINIEDPDIDLLESAPNAVIVAGQNVRIEGIERGRCEELLPFSSLNRDTQSKLLENSENILVANSSFFETSSYSPAGLFASLMTNFRALQTDFDLLDDFIEDLTDECDFKTEDIETRERILRTILFETYRIGVPVI